MYHMHENLSCLNLVKCLLGIYTANFANVAYSLRFILDGTKEWFSHIQKLLSSLYGSLFFSKPFIVNSQVLLD